MTAVSSICSAMNCCFYGKNDKHVRKRIDYGRRDIEETKSDCSKLIKINVMLEFISINKTIW